MNEQYNGVPDVELEDVREREERRKMYDEIEKEQKENVVKIDRLWKRKLDKKISKVEAEIEEFCMQESLTFQLSKQDRIEQMRRVRLAMKKVMTFGEQMKSLKMEEAKERVDILEKRLIELVSSIGKEREVEDRNVVQQIKERL